MISSENDFCVRTSKYQWRQGFGFQCLGGLIDKNVGKEVINHLKVQQHFRCAQSGDNHSTFKNILKSRQQEYTFFDQAVIPRNFWCCLQSTWNLQNWKKLMFAMTIIVVNYTSWWVIVRLVCMDIRRWAQKKKECSWSRKRDITE